MFIDSTTDNNASTSDAGDEDKDKSLEGNKVKEEEMGIDCVSSEGEKAGGSENVQVTFLLFFFIFG